MKVKLEEREHAEKSFHEKYA